MDARCQALMQDRCPSCRASNFAVVMELLVFVEKFANVKSVRKGVCKKVEEICFIL